MPPTLLACGSNGAGQLAIGHTEDVSTFTPCHFDATCPAEGEILELVAQGSHSLLLLRHAGGALLLGAGTNTHGQLGLKCALSEQEVPKTSFRPLSLARDAGVENWEPVKIAATWTTSFVVFERGGKQKVIAAGSNDFGELGLGTPSGPDIKEVDIGLQEGERVELIRGGQRHVVALIRGPGGKQGKQRVVGWGAARHGELDPTCTGERVETGKRPARPAYLPPTDMQLVLDPIEPIVDIRLGAAHTLVMMDEAGIRAWGSNTKGQINGLNDPTFRFGSIATSWGGSYLSVDEELSHCSYEELFSQGSNTHGQLLREGDPTKQGFVNIESEPFQIAAGSEHLLIVAETAGEFPEGLQVGGWNEHGNLGLGDRLDRAEPTPVNLGASIQRVWAGCATSWVLTGDKEHKFGGSSSRVGRFDKLWVHTVRP